MSPGGRTRPVPTRRLAVVAAAASLVLLVVPVAGLWPLLVVNAVLLVAAALDAAAATDPARFELRRDLPPALVLGGSGELSWTVRNPTGRRVRVQLADGLAPSLRAPTRRFGGAVPPGARLSATTTLRPARRGRFDLDAVTVRVPGPLGIGARQRTVSVPGVVRVHPVFRSRDEAELRITRARILEVGLRSARGRGGGTDFDQLREYAIDDEVRRIDWAATARAGRAMVRTYRAERNQNVLLLLDTGRTMAGRVAEVPRLEHAMDAAMCVTAVASRLGDRCGLVTFDRRVRTVVPGRAGRAQLGRVSEALYDLEPDLVESDYTGVFTEVLARFRRRALIVLLTDLVEQAVGESLLPALPILARHHLVIVAAVRDPDVAAWAVEPPEDAPTAYRAAAAVGALEERARATARLRSLGATVVDAAPGDLAPRLADEYLDLKATGRL
jgi:uncharacterized protein (DUF58 family)